MSVRVADLFSGAGGFSEGFHQMGFSVTKAIDFWHPAVVTHAHNHPDTDAVQANLLTYTPEMLGPIDVLIGSPPCTQFSFANKGGGGDIEKGLELVYRFLHFVAVLEPKWWLMENVPRVLQFLPQPGDGIPYRSLGLDRPGKLIIPRACVYNSADFGAPQRRLRGIAGQFPEPVKTHDQFGAGGLPRWRMLGDVVSAFPDPLSRLRPTASVTDPVNPHFTVDAEDLTDHFTQIVRLDDAEAKKNELLKTSHRIYGRMSWPDRLDGPARTQMATQLRVAREATVVATASGDGFRLLTVRESSSVQGFPINYQWLGKSQATRYKLVGNAVAPPLSAALGRAILQVEQREIPATPLVHHIRPLHHLDEDEPPVREPRPLRLDRKYREYLPGSKVSGLRVEIDNLGTSPASHPLARGPRGGTVNHSSEWRAMLYRGSGDSFSATRVSVAVAIEYFAVAAADSRRATRFVRALGRSLSRLPDATTLQCIHARRARSHSGPDEVLTRIVNVVERYYGAPSVVVPLAARSAGVLPERIAAFLLATTFACDVINRGTETMRGKRQPLLPSEWQTAGIRLRSGRPAARELAPKFQRLAERRLKRRPRRPTNEAAWMRSTQLELIR